MIQTPQAARTHYDNAPILEYSFGQFTLQGYSRGAMQTYWRIPEYKIIFDHGAHPWEFHNTPNLAVTHTHADHCNGLTSYVATRHLFKLEKPDLYVPKHAASTLTTVINACRDLNNQSFDYNIHDVDIGDDVNFHNQLFLHAFETTHSIPSQGYLLYEKKHKLKKELQGLEQDKLDKLRADGQDITHTISSHLFAFTGDTSIQTFSKNPFLFEVPTLVVECTFLSDDEKETALRTKHIHVQDLIAIAEKFQNKSLVLAHFSTRYTRAQVLELLDKQLPQTLKDRVIAWI